MYKKYKSLLILSTLVLLLIGMGVTANTQPVSANGVAIETAQSDDDPDTSTFEDEELYEEDYEEIEPPAELIPGYLPEEYELDGAYLFNVEEFEEDAIWFAPGKGDATSIEFYGTGEEDFIEIITSESPYAALEDWVAEVSNLEFEDEYEDEVETEGEDEELSLEDATVTINGVSVLLEDWTDESGTFSSATFIHAGPFIVVEGTISTDAMMKILESLPVLP